MKVSEYIKTLTPEEREKHKDLIEECLEREEKLRKLNIEDKLKELNYVENKCYEALKELQGALTKLQNELKEMYVNAIAARQQSKILKEKISEIQLKMMRKEDFYKA
ncbi:MAG: hypothetical protein QW404_01840 [Candidatus Nanoarchaeia archaeon]